MLRTGAAGAMKALVLDAKTTSMMANAAEASERWRRAISSDLSSSPNLRLQKRAPAYGSLICRPRLTLPMQLRPQLRHRQVGERALLLQHRGTEQLPPRRVGARLPLVAEPRVKRQHLRAVHPLAAPAHRTV